MKKFPNNLFVPPVIRSEKGDTTQTSNGGINMQSMIEQSYALGEAVSVSLIVELLKHIWSKIQHHEMKRFEKSDGTKSS